MIEENIYVEGNIRFKSIVLQVLELSHALPSRHNQSQPNLFWDIN